MARRGGGRHGMTQLGFGGPRRLAMELLGWAGAPRVSRAGKAGEVCVIGHRGAPCQAPENTIASFEEALRQGADAIEADICVTRDREFLLWHDANPDEKLSLARQSGAEKLLVVPDVPDAGSPWRKPVRELDLAAMRAHYGYLPREGSEKSERRLPFDLLRDLFRWSAKAHGLRRVYLDIKLAEDQVEEARLLFEKVREHLRGGPRDRGPSFHLMSIHREIVLALLEAVRREPRGRIAVYADFERPGVLHFAPRIGARCIGMGRRGRFQPSYRSEIARVIAACRAGKLTSVVAWTINDEKKLRALLRMGAPAIMTDEIERLRRLARRRAPTGKTERSAARRAAARR
ncbi:MAG: glycerophosphodiester phosphodiesterase [Thermoanaerobaculia bacterium]